MKSNKSAMETRLEQIRKELEEYYQLFEKTGQTSQELSKIFEDIENLLNQIRLKLNRIPRLLDLKNNYTCKLTLNLLLNASDGIRSEPFQTSQNGYRMELHAQTSSDRKSLSVALNFLPGEYDGLLLWPFPYSITISLINVKNPSKTITKTVDGKLSSQPNDRMNNVHSITPFCALENITQASHGFVANDSIFIQFHCDFSVKNTSWLESPSEW